MTDAFFDQIGDCPIMPVAAFQAVEHVFPVATALKAAGIGAIEVTLRTECALAAIGALSRGFAGLLIGAGTVTSLGQLEAAKAAGARFAVSPGSTTELMEAAKRLGIWYLPGVATASDIMRGLASSYRDFKFFPAAQSGGPDMLKAWAGPFAECRFCPTGGIDPANVGQYAALSNVRMVGSSWMLPRAAIAAGNWNELEARSRIFVAAVETARIGIRNA